MKSRIITNTALAFGLAAVFILIACRRADYLIAVAARVGL
jgi:hypothetical protein